MAEHGNVAAEEKFVKVLHAFADRIGSTIDTASHNTGLIKSLLKIPPLPQQPSSKKLNGARDPRMSVVLEVLQQTICLTAELAFIANVLESRVGNTTLSVANDLPPEVSEMSTEPALVEFKKSENASTIVSPPELEVQQRYSSDIKPLPTEENNSGSPSKDSVVSANTAPIHSPITANHVPESSDKWAYVPSMADKFGVGEDSSDEEHSEEESTLLTAPTRTAPAKVHIKDILSRIDKEIEQDKGKTKTKHLQTKAANTQLSPQPSTNTNKQQSAATPPPRPRIVVGQRPQRPLVNIIADLSNTPQGREDASKKQRHMDKLSRLFVGRPTSMELYRKNILREPGHDVYNKVQQFDMMASVK